MLGFVILGPDQALYLASTDVSEVLTSRSLPGGEHPEGACAESLTVRTDFPAVAVSNICAQNPPPYSLVSLSATAEPQDFTAPPACFWQVAAPDAFALIGAHFLVPLEAD